MVNLYIVILPSLGVLTIELLPISSILDSHLSLAFALAGLHSCLLLFFLSHSLDSRFLPGQLSGEAPLS